MPLAVTSFSAKGFSDYARTGLETMAAFWPGKIVVYYEYDKPDFPDNGKIEWRNLMADQGLLKVLEWAQGSPCLRGALPDGRHNYNFDLYKFCRKVFAQADALERHNGVVYWLDADTRLLKPLEPKWLEGLLHGKYTAAMFRKNSHIESGVVAWDTRHKEHGAFISAYRGLYQSGNILHLPGFHDCWAYEEALRHSGGASHNWSPDASGVQETVPQSPLAGYLEHLKGNRKMMEVA